MADTMFGNMFDVTTSENKSVRDRALQVAQLSPGRASVYGAGVAGGMLMQNLASMAGMKTPEQEKTELISGIMDRATNLDPNDPSSYMKLANDFVQAGLPGIGQKFMDKSRSVQVQNTTSAQKDRELDQKDDRLTADTDYRTSSLDLQNRDLSFRRQQEASRIQELQEKLERDEKVGVLQQLTDSEGNTILAQITTDDEGNYSVKPITKDVVESSMSEGATQGAETTTQSGKFSFNDKGALIVKAAEKEEWSTADNNKFDNIWDQYKKEFYRAGSTWDNGRWQLSEADIEAGVEEVPKFYDWVKETLGEKSAEIVDRGLGGDQADKRLQELLAKEEEINLDTSETEINYQALSEETEVSVSKLKEVPNQIAGEGNPDGYTFGELVTMFKQAGDLEGVEILLKEMKPGTKTEKKKKEFNRFGIKGQ